MSSCTRYSPLPLIGLALAATFAIIQVFLPNGTFDTALAFLNGIAVAIYGPLIRSAGPSTRRAFGCIWLAALGILHFAWILPAMAAVRSAAELAGIPSAPRSELAYMFLGTGLVFAAAILFDLRSLIVAAILLLGTALSITITTLEPYWRSSLPPDAPHVIGFPALPLHLSIALALFFAAWRERRVFKPGHCPACGYDLRGLRTPVCPECGKQGSDSHPAPEM